MKDQGDFAKSYVVARAGEPVDWDSVGEDIDGRKHKKISVFFENFERDHDLEGKDAKIQMLESRLANLEEMMQKVLTN